MINFYTAMIAPLLICLSACSGTEQCINQESSMLQANSPVISVLAEKLEKEHLAGTFSGTILITQENNKLFQKSYGCSDSQSKLNNTAATIFDIGSIAKTFTAAAILHLHANGKLQLTDTLNKFYPDAPMDKQELSIKQLLVHVSGMDNFHNETDFDQMNRAEAEQKILAMPLISAPNEKVVYSNAAYTLLAAIVERSSGQLFQQYVQQNFIAALALRNTGFYQDENITTAKLAKGYGGEDAGKTTYNKNLTWALIGAGGMVSTVDDLVAWYNALAQGTIMPVAGVNLLLKPVNERWSLGHWAHYVFDGHPLIQMGGSTEYGYTALIQYLPQEDIQIVLLLNTYNQKYGNATSQRLSKFVILPTLFHTDIDLNK
jgi:CubicO group peptidase (beta-lactamase class C family)